MEIIKRIPYEENHNVIEGQLHKRCSRCLNWFECNDRYFYKNSKNSIDGHYPYCIQCQKLQARQWRSENPEKRKKSDYEQNRRPITKIKKRADNKRRRDLGGEKDWYYKNKDRHKGYREKRESNKKHTISIEEWAACKEHFNNSCAYCGLKIEEHLRKYRGEMRLYDLHKEHVEDEGANDLSNCVPSCGNCNSQKWKYDFKEWYKSQEFYDERRYNLIITWIGEDFKKYIAKTLIE